MEKQPKRITPLIEGVDYRPLATRGLSLATCEHWGYGVRTGVTVPGVTGTQNVQLAQYRDKNGQTVVAQQLKFIHPEKGKKEFRWVGDQSQAGLFGSHLWPNPGGKTVVITEGPLDAMSVSQLQGHKWPVYSVPNGAQNAKADLSRYIEWLEKFERIVLMFDMDEAGQTAADECAQLFSPGKACIAKLALKDANDMLVAGRGGEVINAVFKAETYRPDGVVYGESLWQAMLEEETGPLLPTPWEGLNEKIKGLRAGQILTIVAGTGIGKSTLARKIASVWHDEHGERVAVIALEETLRDTTLEIVGTKLRRRDLLDMPNEELKPLFDAVMDEGWCLFNHQGSVDMDLLERRIRYFVRVCGCRTVIFDHLMAAVEGGKDADNDAISRAMSRLRSLTMELGIRLILPTHLKSVEGKRFEEGSKISLADIKWPAIKQYSNKIIALERDQQSDDPTAFTFRVLKCRGENGQTGFAGGARWCPVTGDMPEVQVMDHTNMAVPEEPAKEREDAPF